MASHRLAIYLDLYTGPDRIAVARSPNELERNPIARPSEAVHIDGRGLIVVVHHEIESAIAIEIGDADAPRIFCIIRSGWAGNVDELTVTDIRKEAVVFVAIPGIVRDKFPAVEIPTLVLIDVCDRTTEEGQSKVGARLVTNPPIGRVDVQVGVVICVEKRDAPAPASSVCITVFYLCKSAISIIFEK